MDDRVVIVGAGQAGLQTAVSLRQGGFHGEILLLGKECHLPYQRPPLSKQVLKGEWGPEKCLLRNQEYLDSQNIRFRPGTEIEALDTAASFVQTGAGQVIDYDHLVICTGSRLNRLHLSGSKLRGVHYLRTLDDAKALKRGLAAAPRLVVVGAGYIGLEVAASARALGCEVTVVEALDRVMRRSALERVADFLLQRHRDEGVAFHLGRRVVEIEGGRRVRAVCLDDGELLEADLLLKGIGVRPDLRFVENTAIETRRGVLVDTRCRTSVSNVWAAGDCCELQHASYPTPLVLESVQNAVSQGKIVAANILGEATEYEEIPWFWSEQYDCRLQIAGLPQPGDELLVRDTGPGSLSVLSLGRDRLNAIQCVNVPRDYMAARKLIAAGDRVDSNALRDPQADLRALL